MDRIYVQCTSCGEEHYGEEIVVENVEEDFFGRDNVTFKCPVTGNLVKSLVYQGC